MTSSEIEAFLAVCRYKNISRAAQALFISQSSLSTRVRILEQELGCSLFARGKGIREVTLTKEGERFYGLAAEYMSVVERMMSVKRENKPERLRVSSLNSIGTYLLSPVYERFMEEAPGAVLEVQDLETGPACRSVEEGRTDLAFVSSRRGSPQTVFRPVFSEPFVFVCAASGAYPDEVELPMLDLERELYVRWCDESEQWHRDAFNGEKPQLQLEIMSQLAFFIERGGHWAIVPASVAGGLTAAGAVKRCSANFELPRRTISCLALPEGWELPLTRQFLCCLREELLSLEKQGIGVCL